jgi:arylformamidase
VWPGDQPLAITWAERTERGDGSNLAAITLTPHLGAHVDAPLHLFAAGTDVAGLDLDAFVGPATVVDLEGVAVVDAPDLARLDLTEVERLLLRTRRGSAPAAFSPHYAPLTVAAAELLVQARVRIIGIDAPSVDQAAAADLPVHRRLLAGGVLILEGLDLSAAPAGRYELIALPLKLAGVEASPVRAVLRPLR